MIRAIKSLTLCLAVAAFAALAAHAAEPSHEMPKTDLGLLQSLVGKWQGTTPDGKPVNISYELVSGGSAVIERIDMQGEPAMVTVFHRDGDRFMMTHYCSMGNQPRMVATPPPGGGALSFEYVDGTNIASADAPHMHALKLDLVDHDHLTETWTLRMGGKDQPESFKLTRAKAS